MVETAPNGKVAIEMYLDAFMRPCGCEYRAFKLILMDLGMPVMGGEEASKHIMKLMDKQKDLTYIVAVTSFTNQKIISNCLNIGMKEVYSKPIKIEPDLKDIMNKYFYRL